MGRIGRLGLTLFAIFLTNCGGTSAPENLGQACTDLGEEWCIRARECFPNDAPSQTACVNYFYDVCCADDGTCSQPASREISDSEWNDCLDGFPDLSCQEIEDGNAPVACLAF